MILDVTFLFKCHYFLLILFVVSILRIDNGDFRVISLSVTF